MVECHGARTFFLAVSHGANTFLSRCLPWGVNFFLSDNFHLHRPHVANTFCSVPRASVKGSQGSYLLPKFTSELPNLYGWKCWLCWGLTSQSTIFQSYRDGAIASWVINQYFRGVKCLAQGHNTAAVGLEPRTSRSGVRHSTTEPPRSPGWKWGLSDHEVHCNTNLFKLKV